MSIKKPSAVESPYITTDTTPTRLASGPVAGGGVNTVAATVSATVGATANSNTSSSGTGSNVSYYTAGIEGVNELATYGRIFSGANVNITLEQPQYITYNQNFTGNGTVGGSNGQIQFNNNGEFAGSPNLTFNGANLAVGGNVTANYFIGNGSQLTGINAGSSNKIFNGNSYANIANADGSLIIGINGGDTWTFASNSRLIAPGGSQWQNQANADAYFTSSVDGYVHLQSFYADSNIASEVFLEHGLVQIIAHSLGANTDYTWTFNDDANLGLPAGSNISDTAGTLVIEANAGSSLTVKATNGNALTRFEAGADYAQIGLQDDNTGAYQAWAYLETDMANVNTPSATVILKPGDTGTEVRWTYNANGTTEFPNNVINPGNNQPLTLRTQSSGNAYTIMYQSSNSWEAYAEDDTTEANSAYAWIKADLQTANTPRVFINNVRGGDGLDSTWTFDDAGNLTIPGNILGSGNILIAPDSASSSSYLDIYLTGGPDIHIASNDNSIVIGRDTGANIFVGNDGEVSIQTDNGVTPQVWNFDNTGNLTTPTGNGGDITLTGGNINGANVVVANTVVGNGNIHLQPSAGNSSAYLDIYLTTGPDIHIAGNGENVIVGGDSSANVTVNANNGAVTIQSWNGTANTWTFDSTGVLTVPGEGIIQSLNDTVILQSKDTGSGNIYSARLGTNGGLYFATSDYPAGWLDITNNAGNANITAAQGTSGAAGKNLYIAAGAADQTDYYTTAGGNLNLIGGLGAFNDGGGGGPGGAVNITSGLSADPAGHAGNVTINTGGANTWTFDYTGNLTTPGNISGANIISANIFSATGNITGGNILSNGIVKTSVFATGNIPGASSVGAGARAFVVDADSVTFANLYVGGASNAMPVWSDGTNWYIG